MPTKRNVSQLNTLTDQIIKKNDNAEITAVKDNSLRKDFIASFINWMTGGLLASSEIGYELDFTPTSPNAFARVDMIRLDAPSEVTNSATILLLEDDANWTDNIYTGTAITNIQKAGDWYISNSFFNKFSSSTDVVRVPIQDMYSVAEVNDLLDDKLDADATTDVISEGSANLFYTAVRSALKEDTENKSNDIAEFASTVKFPVWSAIVSFFSATKIRSILGITTLSGINTGDQDLSGKQDKVVKITSPTTASAQKDTHYEVLANTIFSDITGAVAGDYYRAKCAGGTITISATGITYTTEGTIIERYYNGSAWVSNVYRKDDIGIIVPVNTAIASNDSENVAFNKTQGQLNNKLTQGGDSPASTLRAGTNNAQALILKTNNVDRLTIDASGNVVQTGSTTLFDIVKLRIRDFGGTFKEVFSSSVTNVLTFASGWTEINFSGGWTQLKGTNSRMVEVNSAGVQSAVEEIIPFFIYNPTVQALLSSSMNWSKANVYAGTTLSAYSLDQGQFYRDSIYEYTMYSTTEVVRKPLHRVARRLYNDYDSHKNVGTSLTTLSTYILPANSLNKIGDSLKIEVYGKFDGATAAFFYLNLAGVDLYGIGNYTGGQNFYFDMFLVYSSIGVVSIYLNGSTTPIGTYANYYRGETIDLTSALTFSVLASDAVGDNKVELKYFTIDFKPAI